VFLNAHLELSPLKHHALDVEKIALLVIPLISVLNAETKILKQTLQLEFVRKF